MYIALLLWQLRVTTMYEYNTALKDFLEDVSYREDIFNRKIMDVGNYEDLMNWLTIAFPDLPESHVVETVNEDDETTSQEYYFVGVFNYIVGQRYRLCLAKSIPYEIQDNSTLTQVKHFYFLIIAGVL